MSWLSRLTERAAPVAEMPTVEEVAAREVEQTFPNLPARQGFEYGVPPGGTNVGTARLHASERQQLLEQLYSAYTTCPWVSACADTTARTVTAGGLQVVTDEDMPEGKAPAEPPNVQRLRQVMGFCNPREDFIQMMRSTILDMMVLGDGYIEITWLLGEPVAFYTLDAVTMSVSADEHGEVLGYVQLVDGRRVAEFDPEQVIHISLDAPRGGMYGVSPVQKALLSITSWLFAAACIKECFRRGNPPRIHADLPRGTKPEDSQRWWTTYMSRNLGPRNIGTPVMTTGGGLIHEMSQHKVVEYLEVCRQHRDEIISTFGMQPSKVGVIESGNLGGGTGEAQDKTLRINAIIPIANLLLEKLNYAVVRQGFGIDGWHLAFEEIDLRDSKLVEEIRDIRLRNGSYTLNRYRDDIGEPSVEGGDDPVLVQRQAVVFWTDMAEYSQAEVEQLAAKAAAPVAPVPNAPPVKMPDQPPGATQGKPPREADEDMYQLGESWRLAYRARRKQALRELPK